MRKHHVDLTNLTGQFFAALANFDSQNVCVAQKWNPINSLRGRLNDLHRAGSIYSPVCANVNVVMQRKSLVLTRPENLGNLTLGLYRNCVACLT